jgi:hypothetical protein
MEKDEDEYEISQLLTMLLKKLSVSKMRAARKLRRFLSYISFDLELQCGEQVALNNG